MALTVQQKKRVINFLQTSWVYGGNPVRVYNKLFFYTQGPKGVTETTVIKYVIKLCKKVRRGVYIPDGNKILLEIANLNKDIVQPHYSDRP